MCLPQQKNSIISAVFEKKPGERFSFNQQGHWAKLSPTFWALNEWKWFILYYSEQQILSSHRSNSECSDCIWALITLALFRKRTDVLLWMGNREKNLTRLPPHSFLGSVFVMQTGRVHNRDWHSWNVKSRPGYVFFSSPFPPITKPSVSNNGFCVY